MKIIDEAIVGYMRTNKRLVIPAFGAFLRKDGDGKVVFVEFLKKDDGVFSAELMRSYGLSAAETAESMEGFIAAVRRQTASGAGYPIAGLGVMRVDANGVYDLEYDPSASAAAAPVFSSPDSGPGQAAVIPPLHPERAARPAVGFPHGSGQTPAPQSVKPPIPQPQPAAASTPKPQPAATLQSGPASRPAATPSPRPATAPAAFPDRSEEQVIMKTPEPVKVEKGPTNLSQQMVSRSDEMPKGMRYQKPAAKAHDPRKKKADMVMVVAIVAATIAILAMIYGMMDDKMPELNLHPATEQVESPK